MGFCHQKDLFMIESKPAVICQFFKLHEKKVSFLYFMKKMWRANNGQSMSVTGDYVKVSHESKISTPSPTKMVGAVW